MKYLSSILIVASIAVFASCDSKTTEKMEERADTLANKIENTVEKMGDRIDSLNDNDAKDDAAFVRKAVKDNEMELVMLTAAAKNATNKEVKAVAKKMTAEHETLGKKLKKYATESGIRLDQDVYEMSYINNNKGVDWDTEWLNDMKDDHKKDLKRYRDAEDDVQDPELRKLIQGAIPILQSHLDMVSSLQENWE